MYPCYNMSSTPEWLEMANKWNLPIYHGYSLSDGIENDCDALAGEDTVVPGLSVTKTDQWKTGKDGFKHQRYQANGGRRILNTGEYSATQVRIFQEKYNRYFYALTGKHIDFKITPSSQRYLSMLEACRIRDKVIMTLFEERPIVWDLMGGSGSDSIAFLFDLNPQKLIIVETANGGDSADSQREEFNILEHNMRNFKDKFPELQSIPHFCLKTECKTFITSPEFEKYRDSRVHLVYLDPSWDYDDEVPNSRFELTPGKLFKNLERTVWTPMRNANIKVDCYILKTRWSWSKVSQYLEGLSSDYHAVYSIKAQPFRDHIDPSQVGEFGDVKGVYHYMVLVHSDYKELVAQRSEWYMDLIRKGKRVYVDKRTVARPFQPRYTDNLVFPRTYEKPNQYTFTVTPPDVKPGDTEPPPETIPDHMSGHGFNEDQDVPVPDIEPERPAKHRETKKVKPPPPKSGYVNPYSVLPEEVETRLKTSHSNLIR